MKENRFKRKIYDLEIELQSEKELKKILHGIYFSNLEENIHLFLKDQINFLDDLYEKINFCLKIQFSQKFFDLEKSNQINEEFRQNFEENVFEPLEKFIEEEIVNLKSKKISNFFYKNKIKKKYF